MMTGARNLLWMLPLAFLVSWPVWGGPLSRFLTPRGGFETGKQVQTAQVKSFSMEGVFFTQLKKGVLDWQIASDRLYTAANPDLMQMEQVRADVFDHAVRKFHITSKDGVYNTKDKVLTLERNVQVRSSEGFDVSSNRLQYYDRQRKIKTTSPVYIKGKDMDIRGKGLVYDMDKASYEVGGRVRVKTW